MALVKLLSNDRAALADVRNAPFAIVKVTATWCGPCRQIHSSFQDIARKCPNVEAFELDIDAAQQESADMQAMLATAKVECLPTFLAVRNGEEFKRVEGANVDKLKALMLEMQEDAKPGDVENSTSS
jgi:thiol-disulfide isomerase/thioredoxin